MRDPSILVGSGTFAAGPVQGALAPTVSDAQRVAEAESRNQALAAAIELLAGLDSASDP